ncbi:MAG: hypothetical protein CML23_17770 [Rhizobiaceae bacterium]|nr:hypothetical protein [Rhizobiaceae bacterium]
MRSAPEVPRADNLVGLTERITFLRNLDIEAGHQCADEPAAGCLGPDARDAARNKMVRPKSDAPGQQSHSRRKTR